MNIKEVVEKLGGIPALSASLNLTRQAVYNWQYREEIPGYLVPVLIKRAGSNKELIVAIEKFSSDERKVANLFAGDLSDLEIEAAQQSVSDINDIL